MLDLSRFLDHHPEPAALLGPDGQVVALPLEVFRVLESVVAAMREGKAITVAPVEQVLTTQEAAHFLGISRPTLVKLLESGAIDFEQPGAGRHRRVRLQDLIAYLDDRRTARREALDDLTREAADAGLYESDVDYTAALEAVRQRRKKGSS